MPNLANFDKTFNNETYQIRCLCFNNDVTLSSPDLISSTDDVALIPTEDILYINISNSMARFVPTLEMEIADSQFNVTNYLKEQNCRIMVQVMKPSAEDMIKLELTFLVKKVMPYEFLKEGINYKIFGELDNSIPLNTQCEYATACSLETDNEMLENPYKIARNILQQVNYKMYPTEVTNEKRRACSDKMVSSIH